MRTDGVVDDEEDYALPYWAGVIPLRTEALIPIADPRLTPGIAVPRNISEYRPPDDRILGSAHDGAPFERSVNGFLISTDAARLDLEYHPRLSCDAIVLGRRRCRAKSSRVRSRTLCASGFTMAHSRSVSHEWFPDYATFAYLADVFVIEAVSRPRPVEGVAGSRNAHPHLQGLRLWTSRTVDAHGLYRKFGFAEPKRPERQMERADPDIYLRPAGGAK